MKIRIFTPAPPRSTTGNRATALRWARMLRELGHRVVLQHEPSDAGADLFIALHARKGHRALARYRAQHPGRPTVVVLTGTDLYRDLPGSKNARRSLEWATRLVVLQEAAVSELTAPQRRKARVIYQSARLSAHRPGARKDAFEVCVLGHLRPEKDPFRAALAVRRLPADSRIRIVHVGRALSASMHERAVREQERNPRYRWLGELAPARARAEMARSRALVNSSRMEGGANAIGEAIVASVPVLASRIPGSLGMLGKDYGGFFELGSTAQLTELLQRFEDDAGLRQRLRRQCARRARLFRPERERAALRKLLEELVPARARR